MIMTKKEFVFYDVLGKLITQHKDMKLIKRRSTFIGCRHKFTIDYIIHYRKTPILAITYVPNFLKLNLTLLDVLDTNKCIMCIYNTEDIEAYVDALLYLFSPDRLAESEYAKSMSMLDYLTDIAASISDESYKKIEMSVKKYNSNIKKTRTILNKETVKQSLAKTLPTKKQSKHKMEMNK